jgi:hypothetical protein
MKKLFFIFICLVWFTSCAPSQNTAIATEAQQKVDAIKSILELTDAQAKKMTMIETDFLNASKKITDSSFDDSKINALRKKRITKIKKILSQDQFIKFDIIENNRIKNLPVRF